MTHDGKDKTSVLYNADCPVCSFEIDHYAAYSTAQDLTIGFDDLNDAEKRHRWGIDADTAARRLHVMKDGQVLAGIPAFIALWREMPKYHWLARIVSLPGIFRMACLVYDFVLAPLLYGWHRVRQKRAASRS